jgi:hypothetical protein
MREGLEWGSDNDTAHCFLPMASLTIARALAKNTLHSQPGSATHHVRLKKYLGLPEPLQPPLSRG